MFAAAWKRSLLNKWIAGAAIDGTTYFFFLTKIQDGKEQYTERKPAIPDLFFEGYCAVYDRKCITTFHHYRKIPTSLQVWQVFSRVKDKDLVKKLERRRVKQLLKGEEQSTMFSSRSLENLFPEDVHSPRWYDHEPV